MKYLFLTLIITLVSLYYLFFNFNYDFKLGFLCGIFFVISLLIIFILILYTFFSLSIEFEYDDKEEKK